MAGTIKGITIEIGGDTTRLDRALKDVNKTSRELNKELNEINKSIKFNPKNTELLAQKQRVLGESVENTKKKLTQLKEAQEQAKLALEKGDLGQAEYDALTREIIKTENQLKSLEKAAQGANSSLGQAAAKMSQSFLKVGDTMTQVGGELTKKVTLPLAAVGAAGIKTAADFEKSMSNVKAISGATGEEFKTLKDKALELAEGTVFTASEVADAMTEMAKAGRSTSDIINGMGGVLDATSASGENLATVSTIVADAITTFGMSASESSRVADVLTEAANAGTIGFSDLGESMKYVGPIASSMGANIEDVSAALVVMSMSGIKGSQAGTSLKNILTNLIKPSDDAAEAMYDLGIEIVNEDGSFKSLDEVIRILRGSFSGLSDQQKAYYASLLAGRQGQAGLLALLNVTDDEYQNVTESMRECNGVASETARTMEDNLSSQVQLLQSALQSLAIKLGELVVPALTDFVERLSETVKSISALNPHTQEMILKFGLVAAAIGPVTSILGKLFTVLGTISGAIGVVTGATTAATPAIGALAKGFGILATGASTGLLPALALGTTGLGLLVHGMEEAAFESDLFGAEVSEGTQEAVGAFMDLEAQTTETFNAMVRSGETVTGEMAQTVGGNFTSMRDTVVTALQEQKDQAIQAIGQMYQGSSEVDAQEAQTRLAMIQETYDQQIGLENENNARIQEILTTASQEKRTLTEDERSEIEGIKNQMRDDGVRILSESEQDYLVIQQRLKDQSGVLAAEQAAEIVKQSADTRDKTIQQAEDEYDQRIKVAEQLKTDGTQESKDLADQIIEEAKRQRDETVKKAQDQHQQVVSEAKSQAGEHVNEVDWEKGEVLSKWGAMKQGLVSGAKGIHTETTTFFKKMGQSMSDSWQKMKNDASTATANIKSKTLSAWGSIKSDTSAKWNAVKDSISRAMNTAKERVGSAVSRMKSLLNVHLPSPHVKLPHFSISGKFSLKPPSVPHFHVEWYKEGGIFTQPTLFNTKNGLKGVGEAGPEAVLPIEKLKDFMREVLEERPEPATGVNITVEKMEVRDDTDIDKIARELYRMMEAKKRGRGYA